MLKRMAATAAAGVIGGGLMLAGTAHAQDVDDIPLNIEVTAEDCEAVISYTNENDFYFWGDYRLDGEEGTPDSEFDTPVPSVDDPGYPDDLRDAHDHGVESNQELTQGDWANTDETFGLQYNPVLLPPGDTTTVTVEVEETTTVQARVWRGPDQKAYVPWTDPVEIACEPTTEPTDDPGDGGSCELVDQLTVAPEQRDGYERQMFGEYDREALLDANLDEHGDYYSVWDDTHYDDAGEVDVDHTVALAEAWDSGAHSWDEAKRDQIAGDPANLTLLTAGVNRGDKSAKDFAEWVPPVGGLLDEYLEAYVDVKATYDLSVDPAERDALVAAAEESGLCEPPDGQGGGDGDDQGLPNTSGLNTLSLFGLGGGLLLLAGGAAMVLARRRGSSIG